MDNWMDYLFAGFPLVFVAYIYISLFGLIRQDIVKEKTEIKLLEMNTERPEPTISRKARKKMVQFAITYSPSVA